MVTTRSQQKSSQQILSPGNQSASQSESISVRWVFFDLDLPQCHHTPHLIKLSQQQYNEPVQCLQELFSTAIYEYHKHPTEVPDIRFWVPKKPVLIEETLERIWKDAIDLEWDDSVDSLFEYVPLPLPLSAVLERDINNKSPIHLVVTARRPGGVSPLPVIERYYKYVETKGSAPAEGSMSVKYAETQNKSTEVILDGRYPEFRPSLSPVAPPITIFHRIFDFFLDKIEDDSLRLSADDLVNTQQLMVGLSKIYMDESTRNELIRMHLRKIVHSGIRYIWDSDGTAPDGMLQLTIGSSVAPIFIVELERELGEGKADPSTQVGIDMRHFWISPQSQDIREKCCCPTLMLAGGGPWLGILGGVFTDKVIVQRLTGLEWSCLSSIEDDGRVYRLTRILVAMRETLMKLEDYYKGLESQPMPRLTLYTPHPRFFPYPTSFMAEGRTVHFKYVRHLQDDPTCVTFQARIRAVEGGGHLPEQVKIVVKFVARYGDNAHRLLADQGFAPALLYCGPILDKLRKDLPRHAEEMKARFGLRLRSDAMDMVVMEYIEHDRKNDLPDDAREQLTNILNLLHRKGYAFGDLRRQNLIVDPAGKIKLIDFDWSGRYLTEETHDLKDLPLHIQERISENKKFGELTKEGSPAYYPLGLSRNIAWPHGVNRLRPILPEHDWIMLDWMCPA